MNAVVRPFPLAPAQREALARDLMGTASAGASPVTWHTALSARDTGGPLGVADATWARGSGPAPHAHAHEDELLVVLSGEIELDLAGRRFAVGAGRPVFVPRGTPHGFVARLESRVLSLLTRQSLEAPLTERLGARPA